MLFIVSVYQDWEEKYLHKDYHLSFQEDRELVQPCPDVYTAPFLNKDACNAIIEIMEDHGDLWSGSGHEVSEKCC